MELTANQKAWVEALRSGKYAQGKDYLCLDNRLCCLGVLCEVAKESGLPVTVFEKDGERSYDQESLYLPDSVQAWVGLTSKQGLIKSRPTVGGLANANDSGWQFAEIADLIEQHADELFVQEPTQ